MWKGLLENARINQLEYIKTNNKHNLTELHEKMFFNELINGLWNYHYYDKNINQCSSKFLDEVKSFEKITGKKVNFDISDENRSGDHIWYISSLKKFQDHYPNWKQKYNLDDTLRQIYDNNMSRWES